MKSLLLLAVGAVLGAIATVATFIVLDLEVFFPGEDQ